MLIRGDVCGLIAGKEEPDSKSSTIFKTPEGIKPDKSKLQEEAGKDVGKEGGGKGKGK